MRSIGRTSSNGRGDGPFDRCGVGPSDGRGDGPSNPRGDESSSESGVGPSNWAGDGPSNPRGAGKVARAASVAVGALAFAGGCTSTPAPAVAPPGAGLAELHGEVRVEGLEDRRFGPETYWSVLGPVLDRSDAFLVTEVGRSSEDRPLREVRWGSGPTRVLLWSQMHGDESTASMALVDAFALLAREEHPLTRRLAERLTLHVVPLLNPDGAARFQRRNAQGVDVNRDARRLATPEGRTLKAVRDRVEPDFAFNLHDQNVRTRVGDSDRGAAIALLAPAFDEGRGVNPVRERAMELASLIRLAIEPLVEGHVARYDDTFNPRAFGDLMTTWGASTVLIESGGWEGDPQKQFLRQVNFVALLAALDGIASGAYALAGTRPYASLPRNGRSVGDLLVTGGTVAVPGLPPLRADVLVRYDRPLLEEGGTIADLGDLEGYEARDTVRVDGLYLVPMEEATAPDPAGALQVGAPAWFAVAGDPEGRDVRWRFRGGPPPE